MTWKPTLKTRIWAIGSLVWLFGVANQVVRVWYADTVSIAQVLQLLTTFVLFTSWVFLRPYP